MAFNAFLIALCIASSFCMGMLAQKERENYTSWWKFLLNIKEDEWEGS